MQETKEINALLNLLDDPDEEVFHTVADKIVHIGKEIIPNLEYLWENTPDESVQERIELLIHRLHFQDLQSDLQAWVNAGANDLLQGALLIARYQFPDLREKTVFSEIDKIKRNIWLELNNYLTPLEQVNVLNSMIYSYYGIKGSEISYQQRNHFFINHLIESRKGNPVIIGILYQVLCEMLELPVVAVNLPRQYILAYFDQEMEYYQRPRNHQYKIQFFIDPIQGQIYTQKDVDTYLKRIATPATSSYFTPLSNKRIIQILLEELAKCYQGDKEFYQRDELHNLSAILNE